jgi:hypothetical protein
VSNSGGVWSSDRTHLMTLSPNDQLTLGSFNTFSGEPEWSLNLQPALPSQSTCLQGIALSLDGKMLYVLCGVMDSENWGWTTRNTLVAVMASNGAIAWEVEFIPGNIVFSSLSALIYTQPTVGKPFVQFASSTAWIALDAADGHVRWNVGCAAFENVLPVLYVRDARNSSAVHFRYVDDGSDPTNSGQIILTQPYPRAFVDEDRSAQLRSLMPTANTLPVVSAVSQFDPRVSNPAATGPARLFVVNTIYDDNGNVVSMQIQVIDNDQPNSVAASWDSDLSPELLASLQAAETQGMSNGITQNVDGSILLPATLYDPTIPAYDVTSGNLLHSYALSFSVSSDSPAALTFLPISQHLLLLTASTMAVLDVSVPYTDDARYLLVSQRFFDGRPGSVGGFHSFTSGWGDHIGQGGDPNLLAVQWVGGAIYVSGADQYGSPIAALYSIIDSPACSTFKDSCTTCQLDSQLLSVHLCSWCNSTQSCVGQWVQSCSGAQPFIDGYSPMCSAVFPGADPGSKLIAQPALWICIILLGVLIGVVVAVQCARVRKEKQAEMEEGGYIAARY